jgi:hypothetical protein
MTGNAFGSTKGSGGQTELPAGAAASMTNGTLKAALWAELAKYPDPFDAARSRQPAFRVHATVLSVLGALDDERSDDYGEREQLTRAILEEHQSSSHRADPPRIASFWTTLLLVAFYPMLVRTRFSITADAVEKDDLDQVVIEAFLSTATSLRIEGRHLLVLRLRNRTRRAVFAHVRGQRRDRRSLSDLSAQHAADKDFESPARPARAVRTRSYEPDDDSLAGLLTMHVGGSIEQAQLDLVIATLVRGERLSAIVDRQHPDLSPADRARVYERVKRMHSRTLTRLQKLLRGIDFCCPGSRPTGLLPSRESDSQEAAG